MHPYIAYALVVLIVLVLVGGVVQWRRSSDGRSDTRPFRHTFDDSTPRR